MLDRPQSLNEMRERLNLAHEEAQEVIVESKRLTLELCDLRDRLRRDGRREKAQDQELIAETEAVILKSRQLLDRLRRDRQREEGRSPQLAASSETTTPV
jgi:hypothetical protein